MALFRDFLVVLALDVPTPHSVPDVPSEVVSVLPQILRCFLVEGVRGVGLEEEELAIWPELA